MWADENARHLSEALTMLPVALQHMENSMPLGLLHAVASFAYHASMAYGASDGVTKTLLTLDKVMILMMLYELHIWLDYTSAIAHETFVILGCTYVGACTWMFPRGVDVVVISYAAIVMRKMHEISACPEAHIIMVIIGATSYALNIAGVMHCCLCWGVGSYNRWIDMHRKNL